MQAFSKLGSCLAVMCYRFSVENKDIFFCRVGKLSYILHDPMSRMGICILDIILLELFIVFLAGITAKRLEKYSGITWISYHAANKCVF